MNFYDLDPARQQAQSVRRLSRYLREYVGRYHPYLRRLYRDRGIELGRLRTAEDLRSLPFIDKDQLRANPARFVLQPRVPGVTPLSDGYETEPLTRGALAQLAVRAALNYPRDRSVLVDQSSFRQRVKRRGQLEKKEQLRV